jgi:hypothetical protein
LRTADLLAVPVFYFFEDLQIGEEARTSGS